MSLGSDVGFPEELAQYVTGLFDNSSAFMEHRQIRLDFPNGYGASVIHGDYTYGGQQGLYEVGVLFHSKLVSSDNPFIDGDSVRGYMTKEDVVAFLRTVRDYIAEEKEIEQE